MASCAVLTYVYLYVYVHVHDHTIHQSRSTWSTRAQYYTKTNTHRGLPLSPDHHAYDIIYDARNTPYTDRASPPTPSLASFAVFKASQLSFFDRHCPQQSNGHQHEPLCLPRTRLFWQGCCLLTTNSQRKEAGGLSVDGQEAPSH